MSLREALEADGADHMRHIQSLREAGWPEKSVRETAAAVI